MPIRRRAVVFAVAAAALVAAFAPANVSPARANTRAVHHHDRLTVLTFNLCGARCNHTNPVALVIALSKQISKLDPDAVLLQQVCSNQLGALRAVFNGDGRWRLRGRLVVNEPKGCPNGLTNDGVPLGDVLLTHVKPTPGSVAVMSLPDAHGTGIAHWTRKVVCAQVKPAGLRRTEICNTDIGLASQIGTIAQSNQIHQAYEFARQRAGSAPLVFGGDFNVTPSALGLDGLYAVGGHAIGQLREVDACPGADGRAHHSSRCNAATHDPTAAVKHRTKTDYIFGTSNQFSQLSATVDRGKHSDHDILVGRLSECRSGKC